MSIQVGIDVGGTFTDAVAVLDNCLIAKVKVPTETDRLLGTILSALDGLKIQNSQSVKSITVGTTLVTNAILQQNLRPVELLLFPGSGISLESFTWPVTYQKLTGELDYRGREIQPPDELEWYRLAQRLKKEPFRRHLAIVGKFSHRNKQHEERLASFLRQHCSQVEIALGHHWGQANFYRRSLTTYLDFATLELFRRFTADLHAAVATRGYSAPVYLLKTDGGMVPLRKIRPVESIYSGPAASILGAMAQNQTGQSYVVIDVGGTTTDIGLVLSGHPLLSSKGAKIGEFSTLVRSLAVRSVPIGADSKIVRDGDTFRLSHFRSGPAYCLGGDDPTPTDAMCYLDLVNFGSKLKAEEGLAKLVPTGQHQSYNLRRLAEEILDLMANEIALATEDLEREWREEPAYKIWEVLHHSDTLRIQVWASGGGAQGIAPNLAKRLRVPVQLGNHPEASNAIGAAFARPTFSTTLHLDTYLNHFSIEESGEQGEWRGSSRVQKEVDAFLLEIFQARALDMGIDDREMVREQFDFYPIVQDFETVGQIVRGAIHIPPGVSGRIRE